MYVLSFFTPHTHQHPDCSKLSFTLHQKPAASHFVRIAVHQTILSPDSYRFISPETRPSSSTVVVLASVCILILVIVVAFVCGAQWQQQRTRTEAEIAPRGSRLASVAATDAAFDEEEISFSPTIKFALLRTSSRTSGSSGVVGIKAYFSRNGAATSSFSLEMFLDFSLNLPVGEHLNSSGCVRNPAWYPRLTVRDTVANLNVTIIPLATASFAISCSNNYPTQFLIESNGVTSRAVVFDEGISHQSLLLAQEAMVAYHKGVAFTNSRGTFLMVQLMCAIGRRNAWVSAAVTVKSLWKHAINPIFSIRKQFMARRGPTNYYGVALLVSVFLLLPWTCVLLVLVVTTADATLADAAEDGDA